ncbi:WhiB family transcriptional regulator [Nocardia farcinica]|nr:WhiB family transcriptional regulator [Nocardia farcinica]
MSAQERIERGDALYQLLTQLPAGGHPECAETDPETFFPERGEVHKVAVAREICARCPIRPSCLAVALRSRDKGIWGGLTEEERRKVRRRQHLAVVQGTDDEVERAAERALAAIEDVTGGPVPGLRRHVQDVLRWAGDNGDSDAERARAVLVVLRPELERLGLDELVEEVAA